MSSSQAERLTGRVKWFNSKTGYGFVTVTSDYKSGTDVFVHHSSIQVGKEQYRYLVQGEYVQFDLSTMENGNHEFQATNITGVGGGQLMCESLLESNRQVRPSTRSRTTGSKSNPRQREQREPREPRESKQREEKPTKTTTQRTERNQPNTTDKKTSRSTEARTLSGRSKNRRND